MLTRLLLVLAVLAVWAGAARAELIFREGEAVSRKDVSPHPWWYDKVKKDQLSGGEWLSHFSETGEGTAEYDVLAEKGGTYVLWLRANPIQANLAVKVNDFPERAVDFSKAIDSTNIADDDKPDLRFIAWVKVGEVELRKGKNTLAFRFFSSNQHHGAIDCFVLSTEPLKRPAGKARPVAEVGTASAQSPAPASTPRAAGGPEYVWVEGESTQETNIRPHPWYSNEVKKDLLSGGDWLAHFDGDKDGTAEYSFTAPKAGEYVFWVRANPTAAKLGYLLNGSAETSIDFGGNIDNVNIASNGAVDLRFVAWTRVGAVTLREGRNTIAFRMFSENARHGAIDCFAFVAGRWRPEGVLKPGETAPVAELQGTENAWPFNPGQDSYTTEALWDLRSLNEKVAGETGFVRLSADGMGFVRGDGTPIRFWSVVSGGVGMNPDDMEEHCRFLAKRGVNMVRLHLNLPDTSEGAKITALNEKELDRTFRFISIAKKNGIYVTLSPFWAHMTAPNSWGLADYGKQQIWGLMFFNPELRAAYMGWITELYTRKNPYTGIALKDEPAIAIAQVKNEDSLLFYTFQGIRPAQKKVIGRQFAQWAAKKYGTVEKASTAWGGSRQEGDDPAAGVLGFHLIWHLTQNPPANAGERQRMADQTQFLAETQHEFYAAVEKKLRDVGAKHLVNAMNWKSADPVRLDDAERWSYSANEVLAVNYYTGGLHVGENNGYRIDPGHYLTNISVLKSPENFPASLKQAVGHPFVITECAWTHPNLYQSEGPFMAAAYMSLTGVDSLYWFAAGEPNWLRDPRRMWWKMGDSYALDKWSCSTPTAIGQFPANAIAFRRGYITAATEPVVYEERSLEDLWQRRVPIISESGRFDPNRDAGSFTPQSPIKQEVDRLAFFIGPVHVKYGGDPSKSRVIDLGRFIDKAAGIVRSVTGQIVLNHRQGLMTVNAPKYQGVAGFLKAAGGSFRIGDIEVKSDNDYAAVAVVSLDDVELKSSRSVLVQVGTTARLTGFSTRPAKFKAEGGGDAKEIEGEQIVATGSPPWQIANTAVTLSITNPNLTKATLLDINGYATAEVPVRREGGALTITLPPNTMYLVLR
jgi:hypothetical protein